MDRRCLNLRAGRKNNLCEEHGHNDTAEPAGTHTGCPLCGSRMKPRARDPLLRAAGMMLIYLSLLLLLLWLPGITVDEFLASALCLVTGTIALRQKNHLWCPECWHVM